MAPKLALLLFLSCCCCCCFFFFPKVAVSLLLPDDGMHLLSFRRGLSEASLDALGWNRTDASSFCRWTGVSCTSDGLFVKELNVSGYGLVGGLNRTEDLCRLRRLDTLDVSINALNDRIPSELGNCTALSRLYLSNNLFNGTIPPVVFRLPEISEIDLGANRLTGEIPREVGLAGELGYLGLYNNFLSGSVPEELFLLPELEILYLNTNNLTGSLPEFGSSRNNYRCGLSDFWIHQNDFSGSLPRSLQKCQSLKTFYATQNHFVGTIPDFFDELPSLEIFDLSKNQLEGEIPRTMGKLQNLTQLVLSENRLNGSVPPELGNCRQLITVSLWGNQLSGSIPRSLGNLVNLNALFLQENLLAGPLPSEIGNCSSLTELRVQKNFLRGRIPVEIFKIQGLKVFHAFVNNLEGNIPPEVGQMINLEELGLYNNSFSGTIPVEVVKLRKLRFLSLAFNNLTGEIPPGFERDALPYLEKLDLTGNGLYGGIPDGIFSLRLLSVLALGHNRLNGTFPFGLGSSKSLRRVILSNNLLSGSIPADMKQHSGISYLDLRGNLLEGSIPPILGSWSNLSMLDISDNRLSGSIVGDLGNLQKLQILRISTNRLNGSLPYELGNCKNLIELDLSKNMLSGNIPNELTRLVRLEKLLIQENAITGRIPNSLSAFQNLYELQLGHNILDGVIPDSIGSLHLSFMLNLSNNKLTGGIPSSLGKLDMLQILDLSNNDLSGEIPPELGQMLSLSFVNVSFNQLSGMLPSSWMHFGVSSPSSFVGNNELCVEGNVAKGCKREVDGHGNVKGRKVAAGLFGGLLILVNLSAVVYLLVTRVLLRRRWDRLQIQTQDAPEDTLPSDLTFEEIMEATESLDEKYLIGRGGHGSVYRAECASGKIWAIKKMDVSQVSFGTEIKTLSIVKHRNLVKMAGYCIRRNTVLIVYEYLEGGTLFDLLHGTNPCHALAWETRHRIALGIAQGLSYLHHDCPKLVVHRDVKSSNILLDLEQEPKIGDFGTAKSITVSETSKSCATRSAIVGTLGYIAPENGFSTRVDEKCDVYSYGVILLELLCRKMPIDPSFEDGVDIVTWAHKKASVLNDCYPFCFLDEEISYWMENEKPKAVKLLELALSCTQWDRDARPSMREVVDILIKMESERGLQTVHKTKETPIDSDISL